MSSAGRPPCDQGSVTRCWRTCRAGHLCNGVEGYKFYSTRHHRSRFVPCFGARLDHDVSCLPGVVEELCWHNFWKPGVKTCNTHRWDSCAGLLSVVGWWVSGGFFWSGRSISHGSQIGSTQGRQPNLQPIGVAPGQGRRPKLLSCVDNTVGFGRNCMPPGPQVGRFRCFGEVFRGLSQHVVDFLTRP